MKWLFLVHQVQSRNSRERVKVWRLIRRIGAVLHRNSVYVLPYGRERLEDLQWVCQQIRDSSGDASIFICESKDAGEDRILRELFFKNRKQAYAEIDRAAKLLLSRMKRKSGNQHAGTFECDKEARQLKERLEETKRIDFFSRTPPAETLRFMREIEAHRSVLRTGSPPRRIHVQPRQRKDFRNRTWATREKIHVDRLASAWLIRRFIDPNAKFIFVPESKLPANAVPFDVIGAEFSHHGDQCTFESIMKSFGIKDKALRQIAEIIHDIDLKDNKFGRPESSGIDSLVRALSQWMDNDQTLLDEGSKLLDALYHSFYSPQRSQRNKKK